VLTRWLKRKDGKTSSPVTERESSKESYEKPFSKGNKTQDGKTGERVYEKNRYNEGNLITKWIFKIANNVRKSGKAINEIKKKRSPGMNGIPYEFYKWCSEDLTEILSKIYNEMLNREGSKWEWLGWWSYYLREEILMN